MALKLQQKLWIVAIVLHLLARVYRLPTFYVDEQYFYIRAFRISLTVSNMLSIPGLVRYRYGFVSFSQVLWAINHLMWIVFDFGY